MQLRPYQNEVVNKIHDAWGRGVNNLLVQLATGGGKCLGKGTPILMYDGSIKPVELVKVGDKLMGHDSKARVVLSTCEGIDELYKITPVKGDSYVVNSAHILSLKQTGLRSKPTCPSHGGKNNIVNIKVTDYINSTKTFKHRHKGWRTGVDFESKPVLKELPPYILGMWLGDGTSKLPSFTTLDDEVVCELNRYCESNNLTLRVELVDNKCPVYHVQQKVGSRKWSGNALTYQLRRFNLLSNKHIPDLYLINDRHTRLEVLAGLLDSDGHMSHNGFDFISKIKLISEQVVFLARSLGFAAYISECKKSCNGVFGTYWRVSISGDCHLIPTRIPRKRAEVRSQKKSVLVTGINVTPIGIGEYYGFEISGDGLFMLGDFTVTHNTTIFCHVMSQHEGYSIAIAHRSELVAQMSLTLGRYGIRHRVIASATTCKVISALHMVELGKDYTNPNARHAVASVDTLVNLKPDDHVFKQTTLLVGDEFHHFLKDNKWGKACDMFPNKRILGVTATPMRSDRKGLGSSNDGLADEMIIGVPMSWLIEQGFLTKYRIFAPPCDVDVSNIAVSDTTGDFNLTQLRKEIHKSRTLVGDIVSHYKRLAMGKLGITFTVDIEEAVRVAKEYRDNGVPAEVITGKTPPLVRANIMKQFRARKILQLISVDVLGEGVDIPAVEVVSMARHTASYGLFVQQFGRALRPLEGKSHAIIIDHVNNVIRHGLPDAHREWSLERGERRSRGKRDDGIPVRTCLNVECLAVYERVHKACPFCGHVPVPADRSSPEVVDGDLTELDPAMLAQLRGEIQRIDAPPQVPTRVAPYVAQAIRNRHAERQEAQSTLRERIALWAGYQRYLGRNDNETLRRFYFTFGTDIGTAQTLGAREAEELTARISDKLVVDNVVNKEYIEHINN